MAKVVIYTTQVCPYCMKAKQLLKMKQVNYDEIRVDEDESRRFEMEQRSGRRSVPQIFIDDKHVGGCDDLIALNANGQLDILLKA